MKHFFAGLILVTVYSLTGCALSEATKHDQTDTELKKTQPAPATKVQPHNTGMNNAAKMIAPLTGY